MAADPNKVITVLCIDGGGVRGLIPATILDFLETYIQEEKEHNKNARLADYFDYIAGTSVGGIVTAMLANPDVSSQSDRPPTAKQIIDFYINEAQNIFPKKARSLRNLKQLDEREKDLAAKEVLANSKEAEPVIRQMADAMALKNESAVEMSTLAIPGWISSIWDQAWSLIEKVFLPKHNAENLEKAIREKVGDRLLSQTITNVIITSFDIKLLQPTVFSTRKARQDFFENPKLLDVCLSTSAAPYFLPLRKFEIKKINRSREFNMVDGGVAANNPTLLALSEVAKEMSESGEVKCLKDIDSDKLLVLSLGTGSSKRNNKLHITTEKWGIVDWLFGGSGSIPILNVLQSAMDDMVDIYLSGVFRSTSFDKNYLRIQTDTLKNSDLGMDNSDKANLENLVKIGKDLLKEPVSALDYETGLLEPVYGAGNNEDALKRFADRLVDEKHRRYKIALH